MRVAMFSAQSYERTLLDELNAGPRRELVYFDTRLESWTVSLAAGFPVVFTREALGTILDTTLRSISDFAAGRPLVNEIRAPSGEQTRP